MSQIRFQPNGFFQSGSSGTPFLSPHEHETKLEMSVPIIRLQFNRGPAFLDSGIKIADTKKSSG
jgi:hypothetical protein